MAKKVLSVICVLVVMLCVVVIPISADFVSVGSTDSTSYTARSYTPVTVYWRIVAPSGDVGYFAYHLGEIVNIRSGQDASQRFLVDGYETTFVVSRSFQRSSGYPDDITRAKGGYKISVTSTDCEVHFAGVDWGGITLLSEGATDGFPMDRNLPKVSIVNYDKTDTTDLYRLRAYDIVEEQFDYAHNTYQGDTWQVPQDGYVDSAEYFFSPVPFGFTYDDLQRLIGVYGEDNSTRYVYPTFRSGVVCDYKLDLDYIGLGSNYVNITFPSNYNALDVIDTDDVDSVDRFRTYSTQYDRLAEGWFGTDAVYLEPDLDFTDWLGSAFGLFDVELFGGFTIGGLLATVIGISLFMAFLKIFAGG